MKIVYKELLGEALNTKITRIKIHSPLIAKKARPGQFVVLMVDKQGERIPLTIVDKDSHTITLIFQEVGFTTRLLGKLNPGDSLYALCGPLGCPAEIKHYGGVILIGGGVGIAEIYPVGQALRKEKNHIIAILGARTKGLLILEEELKRISSDFYITTDDGSYGRRGFTTDILRELLGSGCRYRLIYAVGPIPMMRKVASITEGYRIKTIVSLNTLMVDGTGMCGCCRLSVGGQTEFCCIDGPEFDAHLLDWEELEKRNRLYEGKEKHICKLHNL